jgi:hypothetical protein
VGPSLPNSQWRSQCGTGSACREAPGTGIVLEHNQRDFDLELHCLLSGEYRTSHRYEILSDVTARGVGPRGRTDDVTARAHELTLVGHDPATRIDESSWIELDAIPSRPQDAVRTHPRTCTGLGQPSVKRASEDGRRARAVSPRSIARQRVCVRGCAALMNRSTSRRGRDVADQPEECHHANDSGCPCVGVHIVSMSPAPQRGHLSVKSIMLCRECR